MGIFSNKIVIITGASRGIGYGIAKAFYDEGATLALCSLSEDSMEAAVATFAESDRIFARAVDVSDIAAFTAFIEDTVKRFGRVDVLVNNAGIEMRKALIDVTPEDWERIYRVNLTAAFFGMQAAARDMIRRGEGGSIVNISSVNAINVVPQLGVYASSKAAMAHLTELFAREVGLHGIRVNCVSPGSIPTDINKAIYQCPDRLREMNEKIPMKRRGRIDEVADAVLYLASDRASYITGQSLYVDGGLTLVRG